MKLRTMVLTGGLGAAVLLAPTAAAAAATTSAATEDNLSLQISSAKLDKGNVVVRGVYSCDMPYKARFIESEAMQYQGEDNEVRGLKALWDRPCTGAKRQFQATISAGKGAKFVTAADGGSAVFVQVELTVTDQNNVWQDTLHDSVDVDV
ncbi:hypothetical protein J4573_40840 [Actinomadura barringtoniae]|uniref:Secreted protein n=1 Tax=Actinomadura barringtoniae TaxID=1427535 RepID=A0A939PJL1_9ACTN|nr:hypothetical protein [Actinomadura barringtoniae]MBO2453497.1 hypothetical protein [Actinomadura barringtoniae]